MVGMVTGLDDTILFVCIICYTWVEVGGIDTRMQLGSIYLRCDCAICDSSIAVFLATGFMLPETREVQTS
jgi:hypothetical protein